MATIEQLTNALVNADKAGDVDAARTLAAEIQRMRSAPAPKPDTGNQNVDGATVFVDDMLFGLPGKAAAGVNALVRAPFTDKSIGEEYSTIRNQYNNARDQYAEANPVSNAAASIGGAVMGGATGAALAGNAVRAVAPQMASRMAGSYAGRMAGDAASGVAQGALSAFGHDQDIGTGAAIGGVAGGLTRPIVSAGGAALNAIGGLVGIGNNARAQSAIAEAISRSGRSVDDVADDLARATAQGQPEYMVADSLGNSGQRMLTGIARSPGDMRQNIYDTLNSRQMGQGERLSNAVSEGFDAPRTAEQTRRALTEARTSNANTNYTAARNSAGAVDPTPAIQQADNFLSPGASGVMNPGNNIADDSIEASVRRARSYLTDGRSVLTDFNAALRAKQELDAMIEGAKPAVQRELIPIRNALDDQLASASGPYSTARDQFRRESQNINAIELGENAASPRARAADNIDQFSRLQPEQQAPFRVGYADPYLQKIEGASMSPTTNKARALQTGKTQQEFPAFAAPGRGDVMGERIAREQRMFETATQALGGSRTADNLSDIADVQGFDPTLIGIGMNALTGNIKTAAVQGLQKGLNSVQGRNQQTRDLIAQMLLQGSPTQARAQLSQAVSSGQRLTRAQESIIRSLIGGTATQYGRAN